MTISASVIAQIRERRMAGDKLIAIAIDHNVSEASVSKYVRDIPRPQFATIAHNGESHTVTEWAKKLGVWPSTLWKRLRNGMAPDVALTPKQLKPRPERRARPPLSITINGETRTLTEWSRLSGVAKSTIWKRHEAGCRDERLLSKEFVRLRPRVQPQLATSRAWRERMEKAAREAGR